MAKDFDGFSNLCPVLTFLTFFICQSFLIDKNVEKIAYRDIQNFQRKNAFKITAGNKFHYDCLGICFVIVSEILRLFAADRKIV